MAAPGGGSPSGGSAEELSLIDEGLHTLALHLPPPAASRLRLLNAHSNFLSTCADVDLGAFPTLRELNLSSNDLCTLDGLQGLPALEALNVSSNRLGAIDVPLVRLASLRSLNLSYNRIGSLAPLGELGRGSADHPLAALQLQGNQLRGLGEAAQLRHFRHLAEVVFRRDTTGNPLCELPGYPGAMLRDGLPACVLCLDGVPTEVWAQEPPPPPPPPVADPPPPPPPRQQPPQLLSPPPSPWVSVAGRDDTPPNAGVAQQNSTPNLDAALSSFKSRQAGSSSHRGSGPGALQSTQAVAEAAAAATSKRMLYALDQELRLEKLESNLARIAAGIEASNASGHSVGAPEESEEQRREPYRPRLPVDPRQPGLGRNLQRPVHQTRRGDVSDFDDGSYFSEDLDADEQLLSSSEDHDRNRDRDRDSVDVEEQHNPWGSRPKASMQVSADDPSWDKENFIDSTDTAYWSGAAQPDSEVEVEINVVETEPSNGTIDVSSAVHDVQESTARTKPTEQQSRLLTPRRRGKGADARKRRAQARAKSGPVHDENSKEQLKSATQDATQESQRPAETTVVGANGGASTNVRRPLSKARQRELEEAYAREQEQVKQLLQKLETLEASVAEHEARQTAETAALQEELETERVLRAEVQQLRLAATSDKDQAEAAAKDALEACSKIVDDQKAAEVALVEAQKSLEEKEQARQKQGQDLSAAHEMEAVLAGKLKTLQATLRGLEEEWGAREAAADAVLSGLKADFERAKSAAERAENGRTEAQTQADESARATQEAKRQASTLVESHKDVTSKLEWDIDAYRRSESMLQQKLQELTAEYDTEKQRHAAAINEQSTLHDERVRTLVAEASEHQKQQSTENKEQLVAQRQLILLEEQSMEHKKDALRKHQELELGMMQASNKVRELKELLRVSITKEARSASSSRELSLCVKALREKLLDRDDECSSLQKQLEQTLADTEDQASRHTLAMSGLEVKLTSAKSAMEDAQERLQRADLEAEDMRGEMSTKIAALQAAVDDQGAVAAAEANSQVAALREKVEMASSAMKVKDAVCADQAESLRQAKDDLQKAEEANDRRQTELEESTKSLEQEQELTADLRSQLLGKEQALEEIEEECDRRKAQADDDEKALDHYASAVREKEEMLSFVEQEVEELKTLFNEKEQILLDQLKKETNEKQYALDDLAQAEGKQSQQSEANVQHEATMARLVREQ